MVLTRYGGVIPESMLSGTQVVYSESGKGFASTKNVPSSTNNQFTSTKPTTPAQEASVVIDDESDDDMPIVRKVRREAVEEPEEDQPAGEEIGISTEDAFANYAGEPSVTVNVGFSPPCDRRRSSTTTSCREPRNPCRAAASWRGTRRV